MRASRGGAGGARTAWRARRRPLAAAAGGAGTRSARGIANGLVAHPSPRRGEWPCLASSSACAQPPSPVDPSRGVGVKSRGVGVKVRRRLSRGLALRAGEQETVRVGEPLLNLAAAGQDAETLRLAAQQLLDPERERD